MRIISKLLFIPVLGLIAMSCKKNDPSVITLNGNSDYTIPLNSTYIEPGAVATNLTSTITDDDVKEMMKEMLEMETLEAEDIANAIYYALTQPDRVNINDVYIVPSEQK